MRKTLAILCILLLATATAWAAQPRPLVQGYDAAAKHEHTASGLLASSLFAADALVANAVGRIAYDARIVATTLVNLENMDDTSPFGRTVSQQVASRVAEFGFSVVETRLRASMGLKPGQGEFMLSRETAKLVQDEFKAQFALLGSYETTPSEVYVSLRLARLDNRAVVAAYEYVLPNTASVRRLMSGSKDAGLWRKYASRRPEGVLASGAAGAAAMLPRPAPAKRMEPAEAVPMAPPTRVEGPKRLNAPQRMGEIRERDLGNFPVLSPPTEMVH